MPPQKWSEFTQSCPRLGNPVHCSPPGFSVLGILQARTLEWVAISFSRGYSWTREWIWVSCIAGRFFTIWATRGALSVCYYSLHCSSSDVPVYRAMRTWLFARIILPGLTLPSPSFLSSFCKAITWITGDWWSPAGGRNRKIWNNHLFTFFLSKFRVRVPELHSGETDSCSSRSSYQEIL